MHIANKLLRIALLVKLAIKATDNSDMYNRAFPIGNALFLFVCGLASFGFDHNAGGFILRQKADSRFVAARRGYEMVYLSCDLIIYIA